MNAATRAACRGLGFWILMAPGASALADSCEPALTAAIANVAKTVDGLGAGAAAAHGEMWFIADACRRGKDVEAAWRLERVQAALESPPPLENPPRVAPGGARGARIGAADGGRHRGIARAQATLRFADEFTAAAVVRTGSRTMNVDPTPSRLSAMTSP